jgi:hypothetical protein
MGPFYAGLFDDNNVANYARVRHLVCENITEHIRVYW